VTWRLDGLDRRAWILRGLHAGARCEGCGWGFNRKSAVWARRLARQHTRETGHATRTSHIVVTEYRKAA
jgi:hypothetical protein